MDYRDRWGGGLTLRRLWVLISHLPPEASTFTALRDGELHWTVEAHLLDDLRILLASTRKKPAKRHPGRPKARPRRQADSPRRQLKIRAARRRAAQRRARLEREGGDG